jgi:hypothetical protein
MLILTVLCALAPCAAQNVVQNGSFEDGMTGWPRNHDFPLTEHAAVIDRPDRGRCLQLTSGGDTVDLFQRLELEAGQSYVFQLDMQRSAPGKDIAAYVIVTRPNGQDAYYSLGSASTTLGRWEQFARLVRIPADVSNVRVLLLNRIDGATAQFDEVQVVPVGAAAGPADGWAPKLAVPEWPEAIEDEAPRIDGLLSEGEWEDAARITGFAIISDGSTPEADTEAWIARTPTQLLIAARCHEPLIADAVAVAEERDNSRIFNDEVIEIFIDADNDHETYFHLAVNSLGTVFDASSGEGVLDGVEFDAGMTAATARGEGEWTVEVAIPFSTTAVADSATIWGFNLARERHLPGHSENSAWSATGSRFHAPWRFGDLVGLPDAAAAAPVWARFAGVDDPTPGASLLRFDLGSRADRDLPVILSAEVTTPDGDAREVRAEATLPAGDEQALEVPVSLDERGQWSVGARVLDAATGQPLYSGSRSSFEVPPVLEAMLSKPSYRGRIFSKMNLRSIEVEASIGIRDPAEEGLRLVGRIVGDGGTVATAGADAEAAVSTLAIPCADLPDGRYTVDLQLMRAGEVLGAVRGLPLEKLPPADDEIWFGRDNNMIVNGEPHFPLGFYSMDYPNLAEEVAGAEYLWYHTYASQSPAQLAPGSSWDWQRYMDTGAEHGMRAFLGFGARGDGEEGFYERLLSGQAPEAEALMTEFIERWREHPALGAWYVYDEPVISGRTPEEMRYLYEMADSRDPYHPKAVCQVSWSDPRFVEYLDVLMPDPYPIRADHARPLTMVSDAVRAARRTVGDRKAVWAVLQWYGYPEGRYPTTEEMRCMAFLSLAAEAKGIVWYSFYYGYNKDRQGWDGLKQIGRELRSVEDVVFAPRAEVSADADGAPLETLLKRGEDGRLHLIAVNTENRALEGVSIVLGEAVTSATDRLSGEGLAVAGATITADFAPYQPRVLDIVVAQ